VHVAHSLNSKVAYIFLVGKSEENRKLGRTGCRWEDNIQRDIQEVQWRVGVNLSAQNKVRCWWVLVNVVIFHIRALGNIYTYIAGLNQRTHTDKICFYSILIFIQYFSSFCYHHQGALQEY